MPKHDHIIPDLTAQPAENTPLARLIGERQESAEFSRYRRLGGLFEAFHLKYTVTSQVRGRWAVVNGKEVINFASANYLGLEQHPEVLRASKEAIDHLGTHAGCSRVFSSHSNMIALERELAEMTGCERVLVGHNITQIHAGVLPALFSEPGCVLFIDRFAHTSLYQAALMCKAKGAELIRVNTEDVPALEKTISATRFKHGALLVDGVYSMQGHIPPLRRLDGFCRSKGLLLYIDDAHGVGILGDKGGGAVEACGLSFDNVLMTGSLQKALGTYGGFISGSKPVIDFLRVSSKSYIFSGTLQPAAVEGARAAVRVVLSNEGAELRSRLRRDSRGLRGRLRELGFTVPEGESPIIPVLIGSDMITLMAGRHLYDRGIYLNSVLHPAVPHGQGILRISLTSMHSREQLEQLTQAFAQLRSYLSLLRNPVRGPAHVAWQVAKSKWQGSNYAGL